MVSALKDSKTLPWETDTSIQPNTIYCVGWVDHIDEGHEGSYSAYNWVMNPFCVLPTPIPMGGVCIGRNGGGHVSPRDEHAPALARLNAVLASLCIGMSGRAKTMSLTAEECSTNSYTVVGDVHELAHPFNHSHLPVNVVCAFTEVIHTKWALTMESHDVVKYKEGHVQVLCHIRVQELADKTLPNSRHQFYTFVSDYTVHTHTHTQRERENLRI